MIVGVPACDEELLVERSITSILHAASELSDTVHVRVVVACDSCTDATVGIVRRMASNDDRLEVIEGAWRSAGAARAAAIRHGLGRPGPGIDPAHIWVATTDSDTVVGADWLQCHVACWASGDHAIAGIVELLDDDDRSAEVASVFQRTYAVGLDGHGHVHGANLGVRADAYASVGGFAEIALAEDHALWRALLAAGHRCRSSVALRVQTSARLVSRAPGGFADTMRAHMHTTPSVEIQCPA